MINRNYYLKQLIERKHSLKIKIVTGLEDLENHIYLVKFLSEEEKKETANYRYLDAKFYRAKENENQNNL